MRVAISKNGKIINVIEAESIEFAQGLFPDAVALSSDGLGVGWTDAGGGVYESPPEPEPDRVAYSSLEFMDLFTAAEEGAIRILARSTDPNQVVASVQMEAFLARISVATIIYLDDPRVVAGISALSALGILTQARVDAVLAGQAPA
tara:strand:+ start:927 stop:1367 length:441 start_codon:yes stop_codon:yes gene_type:complete